MEPNENELSLALQVEISFARPSGDAVPTTQLEMRVARVSESERVDRGVPCGKSDNTRRMMAVAPVLLCQWRLYSGLGEPPRSDDPGITRTDTPPD